MALPSSDLLAFVDWLLDHGLGASARDRLTSHLGFDANQRRQLSEQVSPRACVYFVTTTPDGEHAWAMPAKVHLKAPPVRRVDSRALEALTAASTQVREVFGATVLHQHTLFLEAESHADIEGNSVGLAAALAYAWELSQQVRTGLDRPVFATGRVLDGGAIGDVAFVPAKVEAALRDLRDRDGYVLVPPGSPRFKDERVVMCATLADALERVAGSRRPTLDLRFVQFDRWLEDVDRKRSKEALAELASVDPDSLTELDRCGLLIVRGKHYRHDGQTDAALVDHEEAVRLATHHRARADRRHHALLELNNTRIDRFELDEALSAFADMLEKHEFATAEREIEVRGSHARALALAGRFEDALRERRVTMDLHGHGAGARQTEPRSLVELAQLLARCGDAAGFDATIGQLAASRRPDVESDQPVWNTLAGLRGNGALGRHAEITAWYDGRELFPGALSYEALVGIRDSAARAGYPTCTVVRQVARSLRKMARVEEAIALCESLRIQQRGLVGWLGWLVYVERALSLHALGREEAAEAQLANVREQLRGCHPKACRRHHALLEGNWTAIDCEIDDVYY